MVLLWLAGTPIAVLAVPGAILGTIAARRWPAAAVVGILGIGAFIGSLTAFVGLPVESMTQVGLVCLWLAVLIVYLTGEPRGRLWVWPGLALPTAYALLTCVYVFTSESLSLAFLDFRVTVWYMLATLLLAVAPWSAEVFRRIARGVLVVALLVGIYAVYRYIVGPSDDELTLAGSTVQRISPTVAIRFFGSFLSAFQLAAWCAVAVPFLLAMAFYFRGRWRGIAAAALAMSVFAIFASDVRTGLVAAVLGLAVVMPLFLIAPVFAGQRVAASFLATVGILVAGFGGYTVVVSGSEERSERFERILQPTQDLAYQERLTRWEEALAVMADEPLGYGLGTQGYVGQSKNPEGQTGPFNLDSAYLKIGIQQGYIGMALFILGLVSLMLALGVRAVRATSRWSAAAAIGACGSLAASAFLLYTGIYALEGQPALFTWIIAGIGVAQFTSSARTQDPEPPPSELPAHSRP
jgi:hypothetical protein